MMGSHSNKIARRRTETVIPPLGTVHDGKRITFQPVFNNNILASFTSFYLVSLVFVRKSEDHALYFVRLRQEGEHLAHFFFSSIQAIAITVVGSLQLWVG
ncbi:hypothetical protein JB92DRAFT_264645 [Gautieria morchelliformis]|nr:hypothetical protein JB92DRAFT_264645 [Gautieria morchelliformis]